jgi:hypothetical protein
MAALMRVYTIIMFGVSTYVLAHNHLSIDFSEGLAHDANLLGGDVVDVHKDTLGEFVAA